MGVGQALVRIRQDRGLTQEQVGEKAGLATSYVSRIENEHVQPTLSTLERLAEALGVPISTVFDWSERGDNLLKHRCPVSGSGVCIGQQIRSDRGRSPEHKRSAYAKMKIELLQMTDKIALTGTKEMRAALRTVLQSFVDQLEDD